MIKKSKAWQAAIGLQAVDGLTTSEYLREIAKEHIDGRIDIDEVQKRGEDFHEQGANGLDLEIGTKEADIVSSRIVKILMENAFHFSPAELLDINRKLFDGILLQAGKFRKYGITKKEWVLDGGTVTYASYDSLKETLDYDFELEKAFKYKGLTLDEVIEHVARFTANLWQIHPFGEGNTRTTAVFVIKYMKSLGFEVNSEVFEHNSAYFRNALVRANYNDFQKGIYETTDYLKRFFSNMFIGTNYELENETMHLDYDTASSVKNDKVAQDAVQEAAVDDVNDEVDVENDVDNEVNAKHNVDIVAADVKNNAVDAEVVTGDAASDVGCDVVQNDAQNDELTELIISEIKKDNKVKREHIAQLANVSVKTVERKIKTIDCVQYVGRGKNGHWVVVE